MTKTKIALAALLVAGTASVALGAGFDPNPANRYPAYAAPARDAPHRAGAAEPGPRDPCRAARDPEQWIAAPAHAGGVG